MKALLGAVSALLLSAGTANAATLYQNDFNAGSTANLSGATSIATSPSGEKFLGYLTEGATSTLTLDTTGLSSITLGFDLYGIRSLDGNGTSLCCGPDYFTLNYTSGSSSGTPLNATFANLTSWTQSYGGTDVPGQTGSDTALYGHLGYSDYYGLDSTYHLSYVIPVSGNSTTISFVGNSTQAYDDEAFGVDNILVTAAAVPEPATWAMMIAGFGLVGAAARRRERGVSATA